MSRAASSLTVIGLGPMGQAMVERLRASGLVVTVSNRSPEKAIAMAELGAARAHTAAQALDAGEVIGGRSDRQPRDVRRARTCRRQSAGQDDGQPLVGLAGRDARGRVVGPCTDRSVRCGSVAVAAGTAEGVDASAGDQGGAAASTTSERRSTSRRRVLPVCKNASIAGHRAGGRSSPAGVRDKASPVTRARETGALWRPARRDR